MAQALTQEPLRAMAAAAGANAPRSNGARPESAPKEQKLLKEQQIERAVTPPSKRPPVAFNIRENPHLDHGYAVTSYSSQGQTVDRVLIHVDTRPERSWLIAE
jgi:hypothetical protein